MSVLRMWALALLFEFATLVSCIPTISISGTKFYDSNGSQFYIKGVVYSASASTSIDVLANTAQCQRDAALMQKLGVNTIRVYSVDPTNSHAGCMQAFEDAGIYVFVALDNLYSAINRANPAWTTAQYNNFTAVMDAFAQYNNTLGFIAGNEVINELSTSNAALYVKASALDLKKYRDGKGYREIPVGYTGADVSALIPVLQNYLACGSYGIDFFGQNNYAWCGDSSFTESGYNIEYASASGYSIPIFFSETGCTAVQPRAFSDQAAIFGPDMQDLWSGAIIYEWLEEASDYGLVNYASAGTLSGTPTPLATGGFSSLMSQWATLTPTGTPSSLYKPNVTPPSCPGSTASGWLINASAAIPTLNKAAVSTRSSTSSTATRTGTSASGSSSSSTLTNGISKATSSGASAGSGSAAGSHSNADSAAANDSEVSSGVIAGIAVGAVVLVAAALIAGFLLWRRRRTQQTSPPLDLSSEGLEVGQPPPKHELDSSGTGGPTTEHESMSELPNTTTRGLWHARSPLTTSTSDPTEIGSSPVSERPVSTLPASELSTIPPTPKSANVQPQPPISRRLVAPNNDTTLKANAPWETEAFPYPQPEITVSQAQKTPLLSEAESDDELRRLEEEERAIDAQIAESERIRALKEEKLALQAKKAALLEAKEKAART